MAKKISKIALGTKHFDKSKVPKKSRLLKKVSAVEEAKQAAAIANNAKTSRPGIVSLFYYEDLDILLSGYEDSRICKYHRPLNAV